MDKIAGHHLEVGTNDRGEVVINHPMLQQDEDGGHLVFSPRQARSLADTLYKKAAEADGQPQWWSASSRDITKLRAAQKAADALPEGPDKEALVFAVFQWMDTVFIDHTPLTAKELEWGKKVAAGLFPEEIG